MEIENVQDRGSNGEKRHGGSSSPVLGLRPSRDERGMWLAWEDLSVLLPQHGSGHAKKLLNGLNGYAEPGRLMAIMGPSGSGKSTLLDSLAGRLSGKVVMSGNVFLNGKRKANPGGIAYVTQNDVLLGTLTVRETITYSAELRLPSTTTKEEINGTVEGTLEELGLQECADRLIGNWHLRGISGGEKKRLSIALEILTRPNLLFLDEPTSGLDSASAFFIVQSLRNIAHDGRTILSAIHQPSSEVFALFDDLYLLSAGETVFFGEAKMAVEFFAEAGFPCSSHRNPSDHFLRCINSDFDNVTSFIRSHKVHGAYKNDLIGLEFDSLLPDGPKLKGEEILTNMFGITLEYSKWWDLAAVVIILLFYRLIFYAILKFKEKASPLLRTFHAKRTIQGLIKESSVQKIPSFHRKRLQSLRSLSSQEGLGSPIY